MTTPNESATNAAATSDSDRELVITRIMDVPRDRAFRLWTDEKLLDKWWGPHGWGVSKADWDLKPGGRALIVMRGPDGAEFPYDGAFLDVVPPSKVIFTDAYRAGFIPAAQAFMTVVTTFEPSEGNKTKLTLRAQHWSVADREKHEQMGFFKGWGESLDRFEALVTQK